jgi:hypothetical protein
LAFDWHAQKICVVETNMALSTQTQNNDSAQKLALQAQEEQRVTSLLFTVLPLLELHSTGVLAKQLKTLPAHVYGDIWTWLNTVPVSPNQTKLLDVATRVFTDLGKLRRAQAYYLVCSKEPVNHDKLCTNATVAAHYMWRKLFKWGQKPKPNTA